MQVLTTMNDNWRILSFHHHHHHITTTTISSHHWKLNLIRCVYVLCLEKQLSVWYKIYICCTYIVAVYKRGYIREHLDPIGRKVSSFMHPSNHPPQHFVLSHYLINENENVASYMRKKLKNYIFMMKQKKCSKKNFIMNFK